MPDMKVLKYPNFKEKGKVFCVKCQKCNIENYAPNVIDGFCSWCGEDHNNYEVQNKNILL